MRNKNPNSDPVLQLAAAWFKKLDQPSNAAYRIAHVRYDPDENTQARGAHDETVVLEAYRATSDIRMERLAQAVKMLGQEP